MLKRRTGALIRRRGVFGRGLPEAMASILCAVALSPVSLLRSSVLLIRLVLAVSLLLPSVVYADPPAAAPVLPPNSLSLSGSGPGNQGATGRSGTNSSGSGTTSGQNGSNPSGGSTGQSSASSTGASDSSTIPPTGSSVAPNTDDLENDPRGMQVIVLFKEVLARKPNSRELSDRVGDLVNNRTTLAAMRNQLLASDERYKLQVNSLYSKYLGRPIDQPTWDNLVKAHPRSSIDALKGALERSDEFKRRQIIDLYIKHLDRAPDSKAVQALLQANSGQPLNTLQLENDLRFSTEYATQWYINAYAQRRKKCPSADEIKAIVPLLTSKKVSYAQAAQGLDAQVPRDFDGSSLVVNDPIPSLCPIAFDNTSKQARTQLANYVLTSVQTKISNPRDFQIADLRNRLANLRAEIEKQTSLLNGTRQNISSLKKRLDELTGLSYAVASVSGTVTATKRNLDGMRDLEAEQAMRLEQLQQSARALERIIAKFEEGGGDDDLYYSAPNETRATLVTTDASREADRKFGEELSRASYKLAIAEGGLKTVQGTLVTFAVVGTVVMSGGVTAPILLTAAANGSVIAFISSRSEAVGQVSAGNLTYTEAHNKATNDFLRGTGLACITAANVGTGGLTKIGVQSLSKATLARMSEGSAAYRVVYWTSPSAAFFASGSASSGVSSAVSNVPTWVSGEKSAAEVAQIIGVDTLFGGVSGVAGGNIKNPIVDAGVDLALATTQSVVKGEIDPNRPQETTEAILNNLISTATSSVVAKLQSNIEKQQKSGGAAPISDANASQGSDAILREAITNLAPNGTLDAVMQKIQRDVLQKGDVTNVLPVDILSRIPGLDPIKKPDEYQAAVDAVSKALEQAKGFTGSSAQSSAALLSQAKPPVGAPEGPLAILREAVTKLAPTGTVDTIMQNIQKEVLQTTDISKVSPDDIVSRIPGLDPINKPKEYEAAVAVVSKALVQAKPARKWTPREIPLAEEVGEKGFKKHVEGELQRGQQNEGLHTSKWPWDYLSGGGHTLKGQKEWLDKILSPNGQFAGMKVPGKQPEITIRDFLLDHFKVQEKDRAEITSLDKLIDWGNKNNSERCGEAKGVYRLALPEQLMSKDGFKNTKKTFESRTPGSPQGKDYQPGGKTFIDLTADTLGQYAQKILADNSAVIVSPRGDNDIPKVGLLAGKVDGIWFVVAIERGATPDQQVVKSIYPAWNQDFEP